MWFIFSCRVFFFLRQIGSRWRPALVLDFIRESMVTSPGWVHPKIAELLIWAAWEGWGLCCPVFMWNIISLVGRESERYQLHEVGLFFFSPPTVCLYIRVLTADLVPCQGSGGEALTVLCTYAPVGNLAYPTFLKRWFIRPLFYWGTWCPFGKRQ